MYKSPIRTRSLFKSLMVPVAPKIVINLENGRLGPEAGGCDPSRDEGVLSLPNTVHRT